MSRPTPTYHWRVVATIAESIDGWNTVRQIPTFNLPTHLGIVTEQDALEAAREILQAPGRTLHISVMELEG